MSVVLKDVSKIIKDGQDKRAVLDGVSCTIGENDTVALVGTAGSGKTALLRVLGCLDNPTSGQYTLGEKVMGQLSEGALAAMRRQYIGFVGFEPEFIESMSVEECLDMPLSALKISPKNRRERIAEALDFVGQTSKMRMSLSKLRLSEKMLIAAARAFIKRPLLVVADEPGKKMFSNESLDLLDIMISLRRQYGSAVIFSTYDPAHLKKADRLFYMRNGRIIKEE
ncbi:MAG: ABC transporter ATP-binding protein [Brevinema sp.]